MENWELLARHHRRVVDEFIESVLDQMDLGDLEHNVLRVALRREVETELVPGLVAVQAVFQAAYAETLGNGLPVWLDRVSSVKPADSEFLTEMGGVSTLRGMTCWNRTWRRCRGSRGFAGLLRPICGRSRRW